MESPFESHAPEETLERYAMGTLGEAELCLFEEHLLVCPYCQDQLGEVDAFVRATRQAAENLRSEPPRVRERLLPKLAPPRAAWVPLLAGLVLVLGAVGVWTAWRPGTAPAVSVALEAFRGGAALPGAQAPSGRPLLLRLDLTGAPEAASYQLEIVNAQGRVIHGSAVGAAQPRVNLGGLARGRYWVRLYRPPPQRELLREFGLAVE
jgi:hypothetical protein